MAGWSSSSGRSDRQRPTRGRLRLLRREHAAALIGGLAASLFVVGAGSMWVAPIDGREAEQLLRAMMPTLRFFAFAILSSSATVLLLMLTLFSVSMGSPRWLRPSHYLRIRHLVSIDSFVLLGGIPLMLILILTPALRHSQGVASSWFLIEYGLLLAIVGLLGGLLVAVMVMLYLAVRDLIRIVGLEIDDPDLVEPPE
jgi:hypothetical protein